MTVTGWGSRRERLLLAGGAAALALLVYFNSLWNGFAYDDVWLIETYELVQGLGRLPELLAADYWPTRIGSGLYRPLTLLSFAVDWTVWGGRAFGFHLTNVILHAAVTALVALFLLRLFPLWAAAAGAAVFAVHPVHTEAVANIVGRAELLAALFVVAGCLVYVGAARRGRITAGVVALLGALYALALLSKEVGVVLPALLLLTDLAPARRKGAGAGLSAYARSRLPLLAALTAVLAVYLGLRWAVLGAPIQSIVAPTFAPDSSFATRLFTMARVWPRYFELLFLPLELSADYSPAVILPASGLTALGIVGFLLLGATGLLAALTYRRRPELSLAALWALVALVPVSNLIVLAEIVLAERTFYLPSVAVSMVAATALIAARPALRRWLALGVALWIVGFSVATVRRNPVWESTDSVFADLQRRHPESSRLLWWLGDRRLRIGDWEGAREWYRRSLRVWPYNAGYLAEFAVNLEHRDELEEAEAMAALVVELAPRHPDNHSLLALIRLRRGDNEGVLEATERGLEVAGPDPVMYALRAGAYANLGRYAEAAEAQQVSIRLRGERVKWQEWLELARLRAAAADTAGALAALDSARAVPGAEVAGADSLAAAIGGLP
jgi:tetratricopeptide (TPR) repeat protein